MDTVRTLGGVAFLDVFVSPRLGDTCTLLNQTGC
jgi:hypothetical protein